VPSRVVFELCAESREACLAARAGGADRLELCRDLSVGGLTPDVLLIRHAAEGSGVPVHVLLRPTAETARATPEILTAVKASMQASREAGAAGFVLGFLTAEGRVDLENTRALVAKAGPLPVTFHRAFDATVDLAVALEDVIATGCRRVLTSGGAADVLSGAATLARLVRQAGSRIEVMAGGGLSFENAPIVVQRTGATHFHASLRQEVAPATATHRKETAEESYRNRIAYMVRILSDARELIGSEERRSSTHG